MEKSHSTTSVKKAKRKVKVSSVADRPAILQGFQDAACERGYKTITVARLLHHFGYQKRSEANLKLITAALAEHQLTVYPRPDMLQKLSQSVRIYSFPVEQLGDLFEDPSTAPNPAVRQQRERALETYIEQHGLFSHLGLTLDCRQFSPKQTQDRFDFAKTHRVPQ